MQIGTHAYILGQLKLVEATEERKSYLDTDGPIEEFSGLYMQGSMYTSKIYATGISGKLTNTVCVFKHDENDCNYGEIEIFINMLPPQVIIRVL